jgi:hypothetical protein
LIMDLQQHGNNQYVGTAGAGTHHNTRHHSHHTSTGGGHGGGTSAQVSVHHHAAAAVGLSQNHGAAIYQPYIPLPSPPQGYHRSSLNPHSPNQQQSHPPLTAAGSASTAATTGTPHSFGGGVGRATSTSLHQQQLQHQQSQHIPGVPTIHHSTQPSIPSLGLITANHSLSRHQLLHGHQSPPSAPSRGKSVHDMVLNNNNTTTTSGTPTSPVHQSPSSPQQQQSSPPPQPHAQSPAAVPTTVLAMMMSSSSSPTPAAAQPATLATAAVASSAVQEWHVPAPASMPTS